MIYLGHELKDASTYAGEKHVGWCGTHRVSVERYGSDTHYIDFSNYIVRADIWILYGNEVDNFIEVNGRVIPIVLNTINDANNILYHLYFDSDEELMMAIMIYPELFAKMEKEYIR